MFAPAGAGKMSLFWGAGLYFRKACFSQEPLGRREETEPWRLVSVGFQPLLCREHPLTRISS